MKPRAIIKHADWYTYLSQFDQHSKNLFKSTKCILIHYNADYNENKKNEKKPKQILYA